MNVTPSDTLVILGGRYRLSRFDEDILMPKSGTPGNWITILGESGNRPMLASADNLFAAVILNSVRFVRLENLEITHDAAASGAGRFFREGIDIAGAARSPFRRSGVAIGHLFLPDPDGGFHRCEEEYGVAVIQKPA